MERIRVGLVGYGNIGQSCEKVLQAAPDMELIAVFTRRDPHSIQLKTSSAAVLPVEAAKTMQDQIDVLILCGGSATDLPVQGPEFAALFNTVDSYDTHAKIPEYFAQINAAAQKTVGIISVGWDPGLFSMMRMLSQAILPMGNDYTFWGKGVSQGHSDAIRRVPGVKHAVQYTVPIEDAVQKVRNGENPQFTTRQKHTRECFIVPEAGADQDQITREIQSMPNYFAEYDTYVYFISEAEFQQNHQKMPHGGFVFRSGNTGDNHHLIEFSIKLQSNPDFTSSILVAYARAAVRFAIEGSFGAKTVFDVPLNYLSPKDPAALIKEML